MPVISRNEQTIGAEIKVLEDQYKMICKSIVENMNRGHGLIGWFEQQDRINDASLIDIKIVLLKQERDAIIKAQSSDRSPP